MPYDRFVSLQLAADQMPGTAPRDLAALGFLTVGKWFTGNLPDVIDDQIDVVTRGLLGMTAQCARCHDHKYDPISTSEYYSLYGLFAASRMPVEGMGLSAELPEVGPRLVDAATEKEIAELHRQQDDFLLDKLNAVKSQYRAAEKIALYLQAAESLLKKNDNDVRAYAKAQSLNEHILFRWVQLPEAARQEKPPSDLRPAARFCGSARGGARRESGGPGSSGSVYQDAESPRCRPPDGAAYALWRRPGSTLHAGPPPAIRLARSSQSMPIRKPSARWMRNNDGPLQISLGEPGTVPVSERHGTVFSAASRLAGTAASAAGESRSAADFPARGSPARGGSHRVLAETQCSCCRRGALTAEDRRLPARRP